MGFWSKVFGNSKTASTTTTAPRKSPADSLKGDIRYVLLVCSLPEAPEPAHSVGFLNEILPELKTKRGEKAKIGLLWETTPIESIDMTAKAVEAFGGGVVNNDIFTYRTIQASLPKGGAKCLVVYDK
jgi:hypothetical protein